MEYSDTVLKKIRDFFEEAAGEWDGENVHGEERADISLDIVKKVDELKALIEEWQNA